jgi:hypothetical protein
MVVKPIDSGSNMLPIYPDALIAEERDILVKQAVFARRTKLHCMNEIDCIFFD